MSTSAFSSQVSLNSSSNRMNKMKAGRKRGLKDIDFALDDCPAPPPSKRHRLNSKKPNPSSSIGENKENESRLNNNGSQMIGKPTLNHKQTVLGNNSHSINKRNTDASISDHLTVLSMNVSTKDEKKNNDNNKANDKGKETKNETLGNSHSGNTNRNGNGNGNSSGSNIFDFKDESDENSMQIDNKKESNLNNNNHNNNSGNDSNEDEIEDDDIDIEMITNNNTKITFQEQARNNNNNNYVNNDKMNIDFESKLTALGDKSKYSVDYTPRVHRSGLLFLVQCGIGVDASNKS